MATDTDTRDEDGLTETEIHELLSNRRRWEVLCALDEGGSRELRELSERVAEAETDESPPPTDRRRSVYVSLHQNHLPRLERFGVVTYDEQTKEVSLDGAAGPLLDRMGSSESADRSLDVVDTDAVRLALLVALVCQLAVLGSAAGLPLLDGIGAAPLSAAGVLTAAAGLAYPTADRWRSSSSSSTRDD